MAQMGLEPRTFRVLGGCNNHYTTKCMLFCEGTTKVNSRSIVGLDDPPPSSPFVCQSFTDWSTPARVIRYAYLHIVNVYHINTNKQLSFLKFFRYIRFICLIFVR